LNAFRSDLIPVIDLTAARSQPSVADDRPSDRTVALAAAFGRLVGLSQAKF